MVDEPRPTPSVVQGVVADASAPFRPSEDAANSLSHLADCIAAFSNVGPTTTPVEEAARAAAAAVAGAAADAASAGAVGAPAFGDRATSKRDCARKEALRDELIRLATSCVKVGYLAFGEER